MEQLHNWLDNNADWISTIAVFLISALTILFVITFWLSIEMLFSWKS